MNKRTFILRNNAIRQRAIDEIWGSPDGYAVTIQEETRNLEQNAAQWPILDAISKAVPWVVNGEIVKMDPEDWKDVLSAAFKKETRIAQGVHDGAKVMIGLRTSEMSKAEFSEWLEFLNWFAADRGVKL